MMGNESNLIESSIESRSNGSNLKDEDQTDKDKQRAAEKVKKLVVGEVAV